MINYILKSISLIFFSNHFQKQLKINILCFIQYAHFSLDQFRQIDNSKSDLAILIYFANIYNHQLRYSVLSSIFYIICPFIQFGFVGYFGHFNTNFIDFKKQKLEITEIMCQLNENAVANFIQKSFDILENKEYESIIHWMANGRQFAIKEIDEFQDHILPKFFRHRNINSFIRQLNMYGFHKSRKDPSKNIFSHPYFLKGQPQILHLVRRKIKNEDKSEEEIKITQNLPSSKKDIQNIDPIEFTENKSQRLLALQKDTRQHKLLTKQKELVPTKTEISGSMAFLSCKSFGMAMEISPFKGLIQKSCVMDSNPEIYLKMRSHRSIWHLDEHQEDDNISIENQIEREKRVFQNRRSGVSILQTCNLLEDFDYN